MSPPFESARRRSSVIPSYIIAELVNDASGGVPISGGGMPADTWYVEAASTVVGLTCVAAPMFRGKVHKLVSSRSLDVVLIRCCLQSSDILPLSVDVTLARGGLAATSMLDLALYRHEDGDLWLVPIVFGGAIRVGHGRLELHLVPPYATLIERSQGIYRTAGELASRLYPREMGRRPDRKVPMTASRSMPDANPIPPIRIPGCRCSRIRRKRVDQGSCMAA